MENLRWIAAATLSAYACHLAVHHTTPIDQALPWIAVAVTLLARLSYAEVLLGVPLLVVAEIAVADETMRLLMFGGVVAAAVACCVLRGAWAVSQDATRHPQPATPNPSPLVAAIALILLRWFPLDQLQLFRELLLLILAVAIVVVLGRTPFAVAVAVVTGLVTPLLPMRTLWVPLAVLLVAAAARTVGLPALRLTWISSVTVAFLLLFFPWSGLVARAFPYFLLHAAAPEKPRTLVMQALAPNRMQTYAVPVGATSLIVSGANVAHMRRGTILGRIEPGAIDVRIGDAADWGYLRREAWHRARNPLPRDPAGKVRDYGYAAWVDGAGRVPLPRGARAIRVTADGALPANASLQVEGFE